MKSTFNRLTVNIVGKPRFAVMEGRDYIVLPVVILMEGVHAGSTGPVLYTLEDMEKFSPAWNHKPIVVNHPKVNGEFVSAAEPSIISTYKVGILMANHISEKGQKAEAWLEKSRLKEVDDRILEMIDNGLLVEVSTGLFADNEETSGEWEGEAYESIARNYRPDHLALLPDKVGACSGKDGCGMFTAAQSMTVNKAKKVQSVLKRVLDNEMSHTEVSSALYEAIQARTKQPEYQYSYVQDVYDDYFIYCVGENYYKQGYKETKKGVELEGEPEEVKRETSYTPVSNEANTMGKTNCECTKEIKTLADKLIGNSFEETDREYLEKLSKEKLEKFLAMQHKRDENLVRKEGEEEEEEKPAPKATPKANNPPKEDEKAEGEEEKPVSNATKKKKEMSVQEYIDNSPAPIREMLARGLQAQESERKRYIDIILSNDSNTFEEAELKAMKPDMLQKLAKMSIDSGKSEEPSRETIDLFNYVAQGGTTVQANSNQEHLELPSMKFDKK